MKRNNMISIIMTFSLMLNISCMTSDGSFKNNNNAHSTDRMARNKTIHNMAANGDIEGIKKELAKGVDVNLAEPNFGFTPLMNAVIGKRADVAEFLLKRGAKINKPDQAGMTALAWSVNHDSLECFRLLIRKKAKVEAKDSILGKTPLLNAVSANNPEYARTLIAHRANVYAKTKNGETTLLLAISNSHYGFEDVAGSLIRKGVDVNGANSSGLTPLMCTAQSCKTSIARLLIKKRANIDAKINGLGITALMFAASKGCDEIVALLVKNNANIYARDSKGNSANTYALGVSAQMIRNSLSTGYVDQDKMKRYSRILDLLSSKGSR